MQRRRLAPAFRPEPGQVYVRDLAYPERMTSEQLSHLAMIAFHIYGSVDLAVFCIIDLQQRGRVPEDAVEQLMQLFE